MINSRPTPPFPQAVLFDFDGTLADGYPGIAGAVNAVRRERGHEPVSVAAVRHFVGKGIEHLLRHTLPDARFPDDVTHYRRHYQQLMFEGTVLLPGARELVDTLAAWGIPMGVCSNKPRIFTGRLLEHLGIMPPIAVVRGPDDVPTPKPAPDMVVAALAALQVSAADALYVGDMHVDILTARAAGVPTWVVPTGSDSAATLADYQPDALLADLGAVLERLKKQRDPASV